MSRVASINAEPDPLLVDCEHERYAPRLMRALNWYSAEKLKSDSRRYIREYVKKKMPSELKTFDEVKDSNIVPTFGWVARLILNGAKLSEKHINDFNEFLRTALSTVDSTKIPTVTHTPTVVAKTSIQDAMKEKISEYIGELEGNWDSVVYEDADFSLYKDMQSRQTPKPYVPAVKEWSKKKMREYLEVYEGKDSQLVEAYKHIPKKKIKNLVKLLASFVEDCDKYSEFKKANRKPRVVKAKPAGVQVRNLKYLKQFDELNLTSVSPTEIVGAQQVWLYNTKQRKLIVYRTDSATGIQVKGSSLQNYEPDQCSQKTLRKPAEQIKSLMGAGKVQLRKFMDTISSKEQSVSGRMNADMIILRVIK